jgi:hypothetical protein
MPRRQLSTLDYIANSIGRVLMAQCDDRRVADRDKDLALAVIMAAKHGEIAAHRYLIHLVARAERGLYA